MNQEHIIKTLKQSYPREVRKGLVKSLLAIEKSQDRQAIQEQYRLINQIFSYVLKECNWSMPSSSVQLDSTPLSIMHEAFPQLQNTQWYQDQALLTKHTIALQSGE